MREHRPIHPEHALWISVVFCLLGMLTLALVLSGCASSQTGKLLNVGVVVSAGADLATTRAAINSGRGYEQNAIMGQSLWQQAVLKAGGVSVVMAGAALLETKKSHPVIAQVLRVSYIAVNAMLAIHNAGVYR